MSCHRRRRFCGFAPERTTDRRRPHRDRRGLFIPYYPWAIKERNLQTLRQSPHFHFHELDLREADLLPVLEGVDTVFHVAAMAGLLKSWQQFEDYMTCNIPATQRLFSSAMVAAGVRHYLHCSTSSVYGRFATGDETSPLAPNFALRHYQAGGESSATPTARRTASPTRSAPHSVHGPRQRPDMGYNIFIRKLLAGEEIVVDGDGTDSRSNTYVTDRVRGLMLAAAQPEQSAGHIFNIGGGEEVNVLQVLGMLEELTGQPAGTCATARSAPATSAARWLTPPRRRSCWATMRDVLRSTGWQRRSNGQRGELSNETDSIW